MGRDRWNEFRARHDVEAGTLSRRKKACKPLSHDLAVYDRTLDGEPDRS